jgi:hypothetical protein
LPALTEPAGRPRRRELQRDLDRVGRGEEMIGPEARQDPPRKRRVGGQGPEQVDRKALARRQRPGPTVLLAGNERPPARVPEIQLSELRPENPGAGLSRLGLAAGHALRSGPSDLLILEMVVKVHVPLPRPIESACLFHALLSQEAAL